MPYGAMALAVIYRYNPGGGGGGALSIYTGGCVPRHIQKRGGGLRHGHNPKKGVLGTGKVPKNGGLRHGHESKGGGGVLGTDTSRKRGGGVL